MAVRFAVVAVATCRFGLTVRYAMKAAPNAAILQLFDSLGVHVDASSCHEATRAIAAGIRPDHISLSTQELSTGFGELVEAGVRCVRVGSGAGVGELL